jgi:hypothetical protein
MKDTSDPTWLVRFPMVKVSFVVSNGDRDYNDFAQGIFESHGRHEGVR